MVLSAKAEHTESGNDVDVLCFPLMVRRGGVLLAVPFGAFGQQALLDGLQAEESELLPNKMLESELLGESDSGDLEALGKRCKFYVIDFSDEVLQHLREYDHFSDDLHAMFCFDEEHPHGLPSMEGVVVRVREWAGADSQAARAAFYSAREDPDPPKSAPPVKKAAAKRMTNAALMEKVEALSAQLQILTQEREENAKQPATSAIPAVAHKMV